MNVYMAHARILHKEPPKQEGRSGLMVLKVGKDKKTSKAMVQTVNQVIIRIPPRLTDTAAGMAVHDYIEVFGHVGGLVRRSPVDGSQHLNTELVAANIQPAVLRDAGANPEKRLFNRFIAIGLLRGVQVPDKEGPPTTAYLQLGPNRPDRGQALQHSGVVAMAAYARTAERVAQYEANAAVHVEGHVTGLLRKIPKPGADGGFESSLEAGMVIERIYPTALVNDRMLRTLGDEAPAGEEAADREEEDEGAASA